MSSRMHVCRPLAVPVMHSSCNCNRVIASCSAAPHDPLGVSACSAIVSSRLPAQALRGRAVLCVLIDSFVTE